MPIRELLVRAALVIAGAINFYPIVGVLGGTQFERLYGLAITDPDLALLLRHRAVLFGLLGVLLIGAAFRPALRTIAFVAGFVSMLSFIVLALPLAEIGAPLHRVFWADAIASALLVLAWYSNSTA
jgi:hypothetical protein